MYDLEEAAEAFRDELKESYCYGMKARPLGIGCQPPNHLHYEDRDKKETGVWGIIYYDTRLSDEDVARYELEPLLNSRP